MQSKPWERCYSYPSQNSFQEKNSRFAQMLPACNHELSDITPTGVNWCESALNYHRGVQSRDVSIQLIQAMAHARLGQSDKAQAELAACRQTIGSAFQSENEINKSKTWQGFWFDWVCARIHLREATLLIEGSNDDE